MKFHLRHHSRLVWLASLAAAILCLAMIWRSPILANPQAAHRLDAPFSLSVPSPHVSWGMPSPLPPVHAFIVPSVSEGRTLVELAQRMNLTYDTVMIDEAWDVNTWTVGTDQDYEARNYKLAYQYLEEDLAKATPYDVIILPSLHGWNRLPAGVREAIRKRVEGGTGLVLIHPTTGVPAPDDPPAQRPLNDFAPTYEVEPGDELWEISPLVGVLSDRLNSQGHREIRPDAVADGPWKRLAEHPIVSNVAFESFPSEYLKHYRYKLGKDATALAAGADGEPIIATKMFGKGRVVALGYVNTGLSPMIDSKIRGERDDRWWEYVYSLLCRSILWAASRETPLRFSPLSVSEGPGGRRSLSIELQNASPLRRAEVMAQVFNQWGESEGSRGQMIDLKQGRNTLTIALPDHLSAGKHYVDAILTAEGKHYDWGTASFDTPQADQILALKTDRAFYARGDKVQLSFETRSGRPAHWLAELLDNRGRLIARQAGGQALRAELDVGNYSTNIGWARVTLLDANGSTKIDRKQTGVNFQSLDRDFGAYELIMPWHGPPSYQPWTPTLDEQFRKVGISVTERPERNFKLVIQTHTPGFGIYWHYRQAYLEQKRKFLETGDKRYLIRDPDLADDAWLARLREVMREDMQRSLLYRPLGWYMADESSLTAYGDPFDLSWSEPTLAKFREWLKTGYPSVSLLNSEWETEFKSWDDVLPLTTAEAQAKGNYAGWMDHRAFMEEVFARALQVAADTVREADPGGRPSISGTQAPGPSNAVNWYRLDQIVDYLQPYSEDDQDDLHRITRPGLILTGFTGYQDHGKVLRHQLWHRLLHGHTGASLFWQYTALNADLTLTEQGNDLAESINEFRHDGLALLLHGAQRDNCGIAVHYSLPSIKGQWITDGHIAAKEVSNGDETSAHLKRFHTNRHAWLEALHDAGYQYDFLTTEQIAAGKLADYRVLVLPDSIALTDFEADSIRKFVEGGGVLLADAETGLMDGHGRWQAAGRLDGVLGVQRVEVRSAPEGVSAAKFGVALSGGTAELSVVPASPSLRATTGRPGAAADETLFLIDNHYGAGRAITLNFWMGDYEQVRKTADQAARLNLLRDYLNLASARPVVDVRRSGGSSLTCSEAVAFRRGTAKFVAILPEPECADVGPAEIRLPEPRYVYDLRAHRMLGRVSAFRGNLAAGEPMLYALLPAPVGRVRITAAGGSSASAQGKAGDVARFTIRLGPANVAPNSVRQAAGQPATPLPPSTAHVEVRNPQGKVVDYYGADLALENGKAEFTLPLALSDPPGTWRITAREPYTHQSASATLVVTK